MQETREGGGEREESKGEERGLERQEKGQIASEKASGPETQVLRVTALTRERSKQIERSRRAVRKDLPGCLDAPSHRNTQRRHKLHHKGAATSRTPPPTRPRHTHYMLQPCLLFVFGQMGR